MSSYDLIVVGAGIIGASCANEASVAGLRVAIVEPGPIGGAATACSMGHLVAMDDDPAELALARYSLRRWESFVDLAEAEFSRCGTLWVARNDQEFASVAARAARLNASGGAAQSVDATTLYELEPALAPGLAGGMLVADEAVVYPPRVAQYLVHCAQQRGAFLHAGRSVRRLGRASVTLDDGSLLSGPVLLATGCALPRLLPQLPLRPRKGHLLITERYPGLLHHQVLELGYADSAHGDADSSVAFNVQPRPTGQILIGSSREFDVDDPAVSPAMLQRILRRAFQFMPALQPLQGLRAWTGLRPATPDGRPYLGAVPGHADLWVAAGHEGLGVTTALGSARLLIDLLLGHAPAIDPTPYAPARAMA
ncbi:FAD-dependent oxidoreductase [Rhodanobacter sp. AS-Z3]|uniref:NAD(P)/FAD-dependent oxidoreductase n=1 Tax=Rhodanobacter sp. AS-Z3 TaxID=3031330 RepID=UPI00247A9E43|nr:FAD-dependent oxidoreductase [Rhodanobacter sp. AS-Z3]WEN15027.1 FAD-dependent oxidoreductase [Rhodanobacter sp. AS-Z3]